MALDMPVAYAHDLGIRDRENGKRCDAARSIRLLSRIVGNSAEAHVMTLCTAYINGWNVVPPQRQRSAADCKWHR